MAVGQKMHKQNYACLVRQHRREKEGGFSTTEKKLAAEKERKRDTWKDLFITEFENIAPRLNIFSI